MQCAIRIQHSTKEGFDVVKNQIWCRCRTATDILTTNLVYVHTNHCFKKKKSHSLEHFLYMTAYETGMTSVHTAVSSNVNLFSNPTR